MPAQSGLDDIDYRCLPPPDKEFEARKIGCVWHYARVAWVSSVKDRLLNVICCYAVYVQGISRMDVKRDCTCILAEEVAPPTDRKYAVDEGTFYLSVSTSQQHGLGGGGGQETYIQSSHPR